MKFMTLRRSLAFAVVIASASLVSCTKKVESDATGPEKPLVSPNQSAAISNELVGRGLAANCFQCHGTNGYASELKIAGINASGLMSKFSEMKARGARDNIMNVHAFAYTNEEVQLLGDFFSKQ